MGEIVKLRGVIGLCLFFYFNIAQASNFTVDVGDLLVVKVERLVKDNYYGVVRFKKPNINMKITVDNSNNPNDLRLAEFSIQTTFSEKGVSKVYERTTALDTGFYEYVSNPSYG